MNMINNVVRPKKLTVCIPARFREEVEIYYYLLKGRDLCHRNGAPLLLIIAGPPGTGKSFMAAETLKSIGVDIFHLSASSVGGSLEGDSVSAIKNIYLEASTKQHSAIICDDMDLSAVGDVENQTATPNKGLGNSFLMNLADNPYQIEGQKGKTYSIKKAPAVIFTVNDSNKIYKPLKRQSRSSIFNWKPSKDEMAEIVNAIFPKLTTQQVKWLINEFPDQPIAFYEQMPLYLVKNQLKNELRFGNRFRLDFENQRKINLMIYRAKHSDNCDLLAEIGHELQLGHISMNHL